MIKFEDKIPGFTGWGNWERFCYETDIVAIKNLTFHFFFMSSFLLRSKRFVFGFFVLALPLAFWPPTLDHQLSKLLFLQTGVVLMSVVLLLRGLSICFSKKIKKTDSYELEGFFSGQLLNEFEKWGLLILTLILGLSLIVTENLHLSFWGGGQHFGGFVSVLFYVALFFLARQHFGEEDSLGENSRDSVEVFLKTVLISGFLVSFYAILQKIGIDFVPLQLKEAFEFRSFSTMGSPTSLGAYLIFPILAAAALLASMLENHSSEERSFPRIFWWVFSSSALLLCLLALFFTENRASVLALLVVGFLYLIKQAFQASTQKKRKTSAFLIGVILVLGGVLAFFYSDSLRSLFSRMSIWLSTWEMIQDHFFFGGGLESYANLFPYYLTPDFYIYEDIYFLADRPHNELLEWWVHLGLLGALFYISIGVTLLRALWKSASSQKSFLIMGLLALMVTNQFSFSGVIHYMMFVLFWAVAFLPDFDSSAKKKKGNLRAFMTEKFFKSFIYIPALGLSLVGLIFLSLPYVNLFQQEQALTNGEMIESDGYFSRLYVDAVYIFGSQGASAEVLEVLNSRALTIEPYNLSAQIDRLRILIYQEDYEEMKLWVETLPPYPLVFELAAIGHARAGDFLSAAESFDAYFELLPSFWSETDTEEGRIFWKNHDQFELVIQQAIEVYSNAGELDEIYKEKAQDLLMILSL